MEEKGMANNYFTAAQAREAAEKKDWINFCEYVNKFIIKAYEEGKFFVIVRANSLAESMKPRMIAWLKELGYNVVEDDSSVCLYIDWYEPVPIDENKYPKCDYLTPLRAADAKKHSDEHRKKELTLKDILDKVKELADVGIYSHTFPIASFCEYNVISQRTVDRLRELGYDICVKNDRLEVHWSEADRNEKNDKYLLTAWDAHWRADTHNYRVAEQIKRVLNAIHDKSTNEGLFEYIVYVLYHETLIELEKLGYKVTVLPTDLSGYKIKVYWGE